VGVTFVFVNDLFFLSRFFVYVVNLSVHIYFSSRFFVFVTDLFIYPDIFLCIRRMFMRMNLTYEIGIVFLPNYCS
jgi:hypothetical protein